MYCKHCGKQIADDSTFCQYCGGKVDSISIEKVNDTPLSDDNESKSTDKAPEVVVSTKESNPIQVEISKRGKDNSSTIANEIVGNLKMIGIAFCIFAVYMIGFMLVHQKDITKYDYETHTSYFGESCYDQSFLTGNWKLNWEQHYYESLYLLLYDHVPIYGFEQSSPQQLLKDAEKLEAELDIKKASIERQLKKQPKRDGVVTQLDLDAFELERINPTELKKQAKINAARDIQDWNDTINNDRKWGYENDLKKNAIYAAIISLLVMILGRYIVKLFKWVNTNKT